MNLLLCYPHHKLFTIFLDFLDLVLDLFGSDSSVVIKNPACLFFHGEQAQIVVLPFCSTAEKEMMVFEV